MTHCKVVKSFLSPRITYLIHCGYRTTMNNCTCKQNIGLKELLNYTTTRRKRLKIKLNLEDRALGCGTLKISNLRPRGSKIC